jgi:hypothetical protein
MFEFAFSLVLLPAFCSLLLLWISVLVTVAVSLWSLTVNPNPTKHDHP